MSRSVSATLEPRFPEFLRRYEAALIIVGMVFFGLVPYEAINHWTAGRATAQLDTWLDARIPLSPGWIYIYFTFEPLAVLPAFVIRDRLLLRRTGLAYFVTYAAAYASFLVYPVHMDRPLATGPGFSDWMVNLGHVIDKPYNCFPSLHVAIAIVAAAAIAKADRTLGWAMGALCVLISFSTIAVKQHYAADVVVSALLAGAAWWATLRNFEGGGGHWRTRAGSGPSPPCSSS